MGWGDPRLPQPFHGFLTISMQLRSLCRVRCLRVPLLPWTGRGSQATLKDREEAVVVGRGLWGLSRIPPQQVFPTVADLGAGLTRGRGMGFWGFLEPSFFMAL